MANKITANEKTSLIVTGQFVDEDGDGLPFSDIDVVMLSIYLTSDRLQRIRSSDDLRNDPDFVVDEDGNLTWNVRPFETEILDPDNVGIGSIEQHTSFIEFAWNSPRAGTVTNPFSTVADSKTITVSLTNHALVARNNVYFLPGSNVGGLDIGGHYIVRSVVDADNFTIEHFDAATSTVNNAGGSVDWYANGNADSIDIDMQIKRLDPV